MASALVLGAGPLPEAISSWAVCIAGSGWAAAAGAAAAACCGWCCCTTCKLRPWTYAGWLNQ